MTTQKPISGLRDKIVSSVLGHPPHREFFIPKKYLPNPEAIGAHPRSGLYKGEQANYGITLEDGREIHLRKYPTGYQVHWDIVSPKINWLEHLRADAPGWYKVLIYTIALGAGFGVGAAIGYAVGSKQSN